MFIGDAPRRLFAAAFTGDSDEARLVRHFFWDRFDGQRFIDGVGSSSADDVCSQGDERQLGSPKEQ
ncbi:MAG: hypothetical protein JWR78_5002, partial [Mycobacterium sp.]|nr:hypothetical protein [Mycobacterium sp.]